MFVSLSELSSAAAVRSAGGAGMRTAAAAAGGRRLMVNGSGGHGFIQENVAAVRQHHTAGNGIIQSLNLIPD